MIGVRKTRISEHPILPATRANTVTMYYNGSPMEALEGEPVAAALMAAGIRSMRTTARFHEPRGVFCAIGRCTDCMMIVDDVPNTRTCVTPVYEGIRVQRQHGLAALKPEAEAARAVGQKEAGIVVDRKEAGGQDA